MRCLFTLLAITVTVIVLIIPAAQASLSGYSYVKDHSIGGSIDGALSDYPVKFVVHSGSGPDSGQDVFLGGDSRSWPYDIRLTDDGDNLLSYWIESYDDDKAIIWAKVAYIPASPASATVRLYYGKAGDSGASDGTATFSAFDDFSEGTFAGWAVDNNHGVNSISETARSGYLRLSTTNGHTDWWNDKYDAPVVKRYMPLTDGFEIVAELDTRPPNLATCQAGIGVMDANDYRNGLKLHRGYMIDVGQVARGELIGGATTGYVYTDKTSGIKLSLRKSGTWSGYIDTDSGPEAVFLGQSKIVPDMQLVLYECTANDNNPSTSVDFDYVFVRKYVPGEPVHGSWGQERSPNSISGISSLDIILEGGCCIAAFLILVLVLIVFGYFVLKKD